MLSHVILGATFGFAAAAQPGPLQTYLISSTLTHGLRRTLPAVLAPLLSDAPIVSAVLLVLTRVPPAALDVLRVAGGAFLIYLAGGALAAFLGYREPDAVRSTRPAQTLFKAAVLNLLNPNPYIAWSLVLGPLLLQAWRASPGRGIALLVSFYATMVVATSLILIPFAGARALGPRIGRAALGVSALALAAFGLYQLWVGVPSLLRGLR